MQMQQLMDKILVIMKVEEDSKMEIKMLMTLHQHQLKPVLQLLQQ